MRNQFVELQAKFNELEQAKVFRRPEVLGITVEYLNPLFLVKKPSDGRRLVTAFANVVWSSKPKPDVNTTLRTIAPWRYLIKTGSETALEEMMCAVLVYLIQEGCVTKVGDDLYCVADSPENLLSN